MPESRSAFQLRPRPHFDTLRALARLVDQDPHDIQSGELSVQVHVDGTSRMVIPSTRQGRTRVAQSAVQLRNSALEAYTALDLQAGGRSTEAAKPVPTKDLWPPITAALWITARDTGGTPPDSDEKLVLVTGDIAKDVGEIVRAARNVRILQSLSGPSSGDGQVRLALLVSDSAEEKSLLHAALAKRGGTTGITVLCPWEAGAHRLWLPQSCDPRGVALAALSTILSGLGEAGETEVPLEYAVIPAAEQGADDVILVLQDLHAAPGAAGLAVDTEPQQSFDVVTLKMAPATQETLDALRKQIEDRDIPMGYKLDLVPARSYDAPSDVEFIREEIRELQDQIARIRAMARPNTRLMRFTDRQLPAMVDTLRRLPPDALKGDAIKYVAGHFPGETGPVHYLVYDPEDEAIRLVEAIWRTETGDDQPMAFWLDPLVADAAATHKAKYRLFVPNGHVLEPSPAHFGSELDETLKLVFCRLHGQAINFLDDEAAKPVAVFWRSPLNPSSQLQVECFDAQNLQPLRINLPWMNDYLQFRVAQSLDRAKLADVAAELYEGQAVEGHMAAVREKTRTLTDTWQAAQDAVRTDALDMLTSIAAEVDAGQAHIAASHTYLKEAGRHIRALEALIRVAEAQLRRAALASDTMEDVDLGMRRASDAFAKRVEVETKEGERKLKELDDTFKKLTEQLKQVRERQTE